LLYTNYFDSKLEVLKTTSAFYMYELSVAKG